MASNQLPHPPGEPDQGCSSSCRDDLAELMAAMGVVMAPRIASHLPQGVLGKIWRGFVDFSLLLRESQVSDSHPPPAKRVRLTVQSDEEDTTFAYCRCSTQAYCN